MPEITDTQKKAEEAASQNTAAPASPQPPSDLSHTKIKGRFNQFQSGYWSLAVPLLSARYMAEAVNEITKLGRKDSKAVFSVGHIADGFRKDYKTNTREIVKESKWAIFTGAVMSMVTMAYTAVTYGDMKRQFKEPLGWEFDKDPDKVGLLDMYRSKNTLVHDAVKNVAWRTSLRFAANIPFFAWTVPSPFRDKAGKFIEVEGKPYTQLLGPKGSVNMGVGTNAMYLASDSFTRKRTFFEELQAFIDTKLNHSDSQGDMVTASDLMNLYDRQARTNKAALPLPGMNTPQWQDDLKLFGRMADLMNQTYGNAPKKEHADFTVPKLIYLLGMGLEKSTDPAQNLAYVEMANTHGIPAVRKMAKALQEGASLSSALAATPVVPASQETATGFTATDNTLLKSMGVAPELVTDQGSKIFSNESLRKSRPEASPASHVEKAAQEPSASIGLSA